jgi:hypothetical protein
MEAGKMIDMRLTVTCTRDDCRKTECSAIYPSLASLLDRQCGMVWLIPSDREYPLTATTEAHHG